jgi:aminobenzoyl-glutamate transport protein
MSQNPPRHTDQPASKSNSFFNKLLNFVEAAGNKLPDPVTLFLIFCVLVILISDVVANAGVSVVHPSTKKVVTAVSLLTKANLQKILGQIVGNFQSFPPLGLVLVVMLGVGVAEKTGLMETTMKHFVTKVPAGFVTFMVMLAGLCANAAGDAGFIVLPPLAAVVFLAIGRHPLAGIFVAYGGVAAGFAANLMVNMSDVLAAGFTIPAAQVIDPKYVSSPAMNYYFIFASTLLLAGTGVLVNAKIVEPRLGVYTGTAATGSNGLEKLTDVQSKGLKWAGISCLLYVAVIAALSVGDKAFMADPATKSILAWKAPLMQGIVPLITGIPDSRPSVRLYHQKYQKRQGRRGHDGSIDEQHGRLYRTGLHGLTIFGLFQLVQHGHHPVRQRRRISQGRRLHRHRADYRLHLHRLAHQHLRRQRFGQVGHHGAGVRADVPVGRL